MMDWADNMAFIIVSADGHAFRSECAAFLRKAKADGMREACDSFMIAGAPPNAAAMDYVRGQADKIERGDN